MTTKLRVALVFGGRSGEHEVSVVSARSVAAALDRDRYELVPMAIDRSGRWAAPDLAWEVLDRSGDRSDRVVDFEGGTRLDPRLAAGAVDVVLPVLHGPYGEDGTIQGLCEVLSLPYAGCALPGCVVAMDKVLSKRLLTEAGLPTPRFVAVTDTQWRAGRIERTARIASLAPPIFVKPARLGSSVGITKVKTLEGLEPAMGAAFAFDDLVIVEQAIEAREIEVAVLDGGTVFASVPGEIVPGHEFYDYADKYLDDSCQLLAPAPLGESLAEEARQMAIAAFRALGCDGMARVDFLLERPTGRLLVNELNVIPGFTSISMYPRLLALSGVPYPELLDRLIAHGMERHRRRAGLAAAALRPLADRAGLGAAPGRPEPAS